jgi:hypothetical protein
VRTTTPTGVRIGPDMVGIISATIDPTITAIGIEPIVLKNS